MTKDARGNPYQEVKIECGFVRVTLVSEGGAGTPSVRIQIRNDDGHLLQGPEVPLDAVGPMIGAIVALLAVPMIDLSPQAGGTVGCRAPEISVRTKPDDIEGRIIDILHQLVSDGVQRAWKSDREWTVRTQAADW